MHFMAEASNMFLVAVEQSFLFTKLANSDRTNILGQQHTIPGMQKESRSCDFRVLGF
jgi:hypothetical protein